MKSALLFLVLYHSALSFTPLYSQEKSATTSQTQPVPSDPHALVAPDYHEIGVLIEYIKLDHIRANRLLAQFANKMNNAQQLRNTLDTLISKNDAELVETIWLRCQNEKSSMTESIREDLYVISADPAEMPQVQTPSAKDYITSASPTAFKTQNVGAQLKVNATLTETTDLIHLELSPIITARLDDRYFLRKGFEHTARGIKHRSAPTFFTMSDITKITVNPGKYNILGIHTPPKDKDKRILVLLKADLILIK